MRLVKGVIYRIRGPARVRVREGSFYALGRTYGQGDQLVVMKDRVVALDAVEECEVEAAFGEGGVIEEAREGECVREWRTLAERLVGAGGRIVVVGECDSGKSTFCTYLVNTAVRAGLRTYLIDADVGQTDVGYPGTISLSRVEREVSRLGELEPARIFFVGSNSPMGLEQYVMVGVLRLLEEAEGADVVVINTDGWVEGARARSYKAALVEAVRPRAVVIMRGSGAAGYLASYLANFDVEVCEAPTPREVATKDRRVRRLHRELSYVDLLLQSTRVRLDLDKLSFVGGYIFSGRAQDRGALSELLGVPVVPTVANKGEGIKELLAAIVEAAGA